MNIFLLLLFFFIFLGMFILIFRHVYGDNEVLLKIWGGRENFFKGSKWMFKRTLEYRDEPKCRPAGQGRQNSTRATTSGLRAGTNFETIFLSLKN